MIKLQNLYKYYNTNDIVTQALKNVNLELHKNEIVAIVGESGSGKTTLLNVICGVDNYDEGEMYFKGNETSYFSIEDMECYRKKNVAFIYQNYNIIESYTVLDNVIVPLMLEGISYEEAKVEALKIIERVGLQDRIDSKGANLSGGEKQRCVIARALASKCEILACDEPTGNLDSKTGDNIVKLIKEIATDKLVLIVTHNYDQIESIATRTIKISDGQVIEDYKKNEIIEENIDEELNLSEAKCPNKSILLFSIKNIINKLKSSIFSLSVLTILSVLVMFLLLVNILWHENNKYTPIKGFENTIYNRVVVYDENHDALNMDDFSNIDGTIYKNSFYEDTLLSFSIGVSKIGKDNKYMDFTIKGCFSPQMPIKYEHSYGELPSDENDCYILFPEETQDKYIDKMMTFIGEPINFKDKEISGLNLVLSGYGYSKEVSNLTFITPKNVSKALSKITVNHIDAYTFIDGKMVDVGHNYFNSNENKPIVYLTAPTKDIISNLYFKFNDIYVSELSIDEYKLVYYESKDVSISVMIPFDYEINDVFELSIYTDNPDKVIKEVEKLGYLVIQPGKGGIDEQSNDNQYAIVFIIVSVIAVVILVFISYIILSKLYANKIKDYNIFRSLGYTKNDMKLMVNFELVILTIVGILLSILIVLSLSLFIPLINDLMKNSSISVILLFTLLMIVFSLFISSRFNKKLFKFTVYKTFYREVL